MAELSVLILATFLNRKLALLDKKGVQLYLVAMFS